MSLVGLRGRLDDAGTTGRLVVVAAGFVLTVVAVAATASPDGFTHARTFARCSRRYVGASSGFSYHVSSVGSCHRPVGWSGE